MPDATTIWITGRSGAGKSTLARSLADELRGRGESAVVIDGDDVRSGLSNDLGFTAADRDENVRRIGHLAVLLARQGIHPVVACISPRRAARLAVRLVHADAGVGFAEVHLDVPIEECVRRDPKGLYARGVLAIADDDYEAPDGSDGVLTLQAAEPRQPVPTILEAALLIAQT